MAAAVALWSRPQDQLRALLPWPAADDVSGAQLDFVVLIAASAAAATLALHFEPRRNVSLLLLPVGLTWWQLGAPAAVVAAGFGSLFGNAARRGPVFGSVAGAARLTLAAAAGAWLAGAAPLDGTAAFPLDSSRALPQPASGAELTLPDLARFAMFVVSASGIDTVLDWLDRRLHPGGWAGVVALARTDLLFNAALLPLAVVFQAIYLTLGVERQGIMLAGIFGVLLVVRTYANLRTLHDAMGRLLRTVQEQRERLDTLVTHSGEAIFTVDPQLRISTTNPALEQLLGLPPDAILGRACADVCHFEDQHGARLCPERCPLIQAQRDAAPVSVDVIYQQPDQLPKTVLLTYAAANDAAGKLRLGIGIARDITAQKENERLREEFVALVTHELRSPLTSSTGYLDLLHRVLDRAPVSAGLDTTKAISYVERIQNAERHLLRLVNNLLDIARVERADLPLDLGEVRLGKLVDDVLDGIASQAAQKSIDLRREGDPELPPTWTSDLYVREVLSNLVSNGIKYTPEGGAVTVTLHRLAAGEVTRGEAPDLLGQPTGPSLPNGVSKPSGLDSGDHANQPDLVEISVCDTGYGMSEDDLRRLFGKFFRSGNPDIRKERGTGLGLALSKQMAERLGGTINVRSTLGEGSTFTLRLPLRPVPADAAEVTAAPAGASVTA
ncbi:MAG: Phosphate regulon sensor protein PhoR (SphS) [uncultured Chloroflexi bacterium]|uniref:histidine kinase n=1 Tax=uncultured Chloroflexota bacterium TaxID=166587 RepID=A0A6J4K6A3_9CHLR|nr:MAG: Phosphate regulon sensor protein PhoR (SphS) [uncultured Chloroflexota bacterium]